MSTSISRCLKCLTLRHLILSALLFCGEVNLVIANPIVVKTPITLQTISNISIAKANSESLASASFDILANVTVLRREDENTDPTQQLFQIGLQSGQNIRKYPINKHANVTWFASPTWINSSGIQNHYEAYIESKKYGTDLAFLLCRGDYRISQDIDADDGQGQLNLKFIESGFSSNDDKRCARSGNTMKHELAEGYEFLDFQWGSDGWFVYSIAEPSENKGGLYLGNADALFEHGETCFKNDADSAESSSENAR